MRFFKKLVFIFGWICFMAGPAYSAGLNVACAANFTSAMKELAGLYEQRTATTVSCAFGATGMLYGQILKGAPYDLFFAADEERPAMLYGEGLSLKPVTYAKGRVVLWSPEPTLATLEDWKAVVADRRIEHLAIANPKTAPYGKRAMEALVEAHLLGKVEPKFAYGKNVGSAFQFVYTRSADIGFVALSQALSDAGKDGRYWPVPEAEPVTQDACAIVGNDTENAQLFLNWLGTEEARAVIRKYGYE